MRPTAVWRHGEWIPTDVVTPNGWPTRAEPPRTTHVISDTIRCEWTKRDLEMLSMVDGRRYTSKSRYRAELRARGRDSRGFDEVGNDPAGQRELPRHKPDAKEIRTDVEKAWARLGGEPC